MDKVEKSNIKRSPNWDREEKDLLLKLINDKLEIIENTKLDTNTNKMKKEAWNTVHTLFNLSTTTERTLEQIQNQWRKIKCLTKTKRKEDDTSSEPQEEEELPRFSTHFEPSYKSYDSNLSTNEYSGQLEASELNIVTIKQELDEILTSNEDENVYYSVREEKEELPPPKRIKHDEESSKRIKLLEISILQKEAEIKYAKIECEKKLLFYDQKKKILEKQMIHINEEHQLRMEKLKLELENIKRI